MVRAAWGKAVEGYARGGARAERLAGCGDEEDYDRAVGGLIGAIGRVLGAAAPDGAAVVWKLALIAQQRVFVLDCWEEAVEGLVRDVRGLVV